MRYLIGAMCTLVILTSACAPAAVPSGERSALYEYTMDAPTRTLGSGERLELTWKPRLVAGGASGVFDVQLCAALFGPFDGVDVLKKQMEALSPKPICPMAGAAVTTGPLRTTSSNSTPLSAEIVVPVTPGFYDLRQISITGTNSTMAGGIVEVRPR